MTTQKMIANGLLIPEGYDYRTDDGRLIKRVYIGRTTTKWKVDGIDFLYRSLWEAYHDCQY